MRKSSGYPNRLKERPVARPVVSDRGRRYLLLLLSIPALAALLYLLSRISCRCGPVKMKETEPVTAELKNEGNHQTVVPLRKIKGGKNRESDNEGRPASPEIIKGPVDLGSKIEMITEPKNNSRP